MAIRRIFNSEKEYTNLLKAGIKGGYWIDAGCGHGAYTIPLAKLVDKVLAIDINRSNLNYLEKRMERETIATIELQEADLQDIDVYRKKDIQGVLFAFSLHYQPDISFLQEILKEKESKTNFKMVIIEYTRATPVYWVPHPYPEEKIIDKLTASSKKIQMKFKNDKYYILVIE